VPVISQWARHIAAQVLAVEIEIEPYEGGDEGAAKDDEAFTAVGELSDRSVIVIRIKRS
jgi:hypothetical protein